MPAYFEFEVVLRGVEPKIWRRFLIRANATFLRLHDAIQDACGWENYHLFQFQTVWKKPIAGIPDDEYGPPDPDAGKVRIGKFFGPGKTSTCGYRYDFGDGWEHDVTFLRAVDLPEKFHRKLLDGRRAFPPEDCGSYDGYERCVRIALGGGDPREPGRLKEWLGDWEPEAFDLETVRREFDR